MPVVYLGLRGVSKAETRSITQPYILALQLISLCVLTFTSALALMVEKSILMSLAQ
jgi:hypothetical protein